MTHGRVVLTPRPSASTAWWRLHGQPRLLNLKDYALVDWTREQVLLAAMSTAGDGIPPSEAQAALAALANYAGDLRYRCSVRPGRR